METLCYGRKRGRFLHQQHERSADSRLQPAHGVGCIGKPLRSQSGGRPGEDRAGNFNYRIVPNVVTPPQAPGTPGTVTVDGKFSFFDSTGADSRPGLTLLGAGYINPINNAPSTLLYTLTSDGFLNSHSTPAGSFGNGNAVGTVGLGFVPVCSGFDIGQDGFGYAYDGTNLRQINLTSGTSTSLGAVGVGLRSLAVIPEPTAALLGAGASLGFLRCRRTV